MKHILIFALLISLAGCAVSPGGRARELRTAEQFAVPAAQQWAAINSPEAAAEELFRAYITLDAERFRRACARPFGDSRTRQHYARFIDGAAAELQQSKQTGLAPEGAPVGLLKVHPAADLPSTYRSPAAYDQMAKREIKLVEVDAWLAGRGIETSRVLVLKDAGGRWGAAPRPELFGFHIR